MGHQLTGLGTAALDTFGGLITFAHPSDLPEGASPRTWDTDFLTGSVFTRPGLLSVYAFTSTLVITQVVIYNDVATFTYTGTQPTINEEFLLSGFTGAASFLNGRTVTVFSSTADTFSVDLVAPNQTITGQNGTAASTTGDFVGPQLGGLSTVVDSSGNTWVNPNGILGDATYASTTTGSSVTVGPTIPGAAANDSSTNIWTTPANLLATTSSVATVSLTATATDDIQSGLILANNVGLLIPSDATVVGIAASFSASTTAAAGKGSITIQLATNGSAIGSAVTVPIDNTATIYNQGSSTYQWGTTLTPDIVNGTPLGVLVAANLKAGGGTASFSVNKLNITVYYTTASSSEVLQVTTFAFAVSSTSGISGFGVTFEAYSTAATEVTLQLLKNGIAVGTAKTQVLTTVPTIYSLGTANDLWGDTWVYSDVDNTQFGVQVTASQLGTTFIKDLDMLVYITPSLANFNYVKSYIQDNGVIQTLALDANGIMWKEDVDNAPGVLGISLTGIFPGSFAQSQTALDREYICFSGGTFYDSLGNSLANPYGGNHPLTYDGSSFNPLTQVGPGAAPAFVGATGTAANTALNITSWVLSSNEVTFTFDAGPTVQAGEVYNIQGAVPSYLNIVGVVLGTPAPTATTMVMALVHADSSGSFTTPVTGTLQFNYPILSITQPAQHALSPDSDGHGLVFWGGGPGPTHTPGSNLVVYYGTTQDTVLTKYFQGHPTSTYVYLHALNNFPQFKGTYLVTSVGLAKPSSTAGAARYYFVVNVGVQGQAYPDGTTGFYQQTIATITTTSAIAGLQTGNSIQITGETPVAWNAQWSVVEDLTSSTMNIVSTQMDTNGVATYTFTLPAGGVAPVNGQIASVTGCNNSGAGYTVSPFNTVGVITNATGSTFNIGGFTAGLPISSATESGIAITYGTQFTIDPGVLSLGTPSLNPIYGNAGATTGTGGIYIVGSSTANPIAAGTRQAVVYFITETGYETAPSPPIVFTVPTNTTAINYSNLPIGPPNVIARAIAFTEAGQNGIPGANFYVIPNQVVVPTLNGAPLIYGPTIIRDNTTTSGVVTFTDAILLAGTEIDVQGNNLFNLIELGAPAWCVPYASRMFYGLTLNKVDNFNNMTFDGGYNPTSTGGNLWPLGWFPGASDDVTLINSNLGGMSLYITNSTGIVRDDVALMSQSAYQDAYQVPILNINTTYSVRVTCSIPSGVKQGTLVFSLVDYIPAQGYNFVTPYGEASFDFSLMDTVSKVFTATLLTTPFTSTGVSPNLVFALRVDNLGADADLAIERIEVFPTQQPYNTTNVFGSYINNLEAIDASGDGGIIGTEVENNQPCTGGFVLHDNLYLMKTSSLYSTQDNPNSEPGGWDLHEVSNKVGSLGIFSYDVGEEWAIMACRSGIFGFNGGQPIKFMQEIWNLWDTIYWTAGASIVLRNDLVNRRILCAVPLPTPNKWMPNDPVNATPTSPNVILMCNYQGLNSFEELMNSPQVHTTMFGTLAAPDMKRKWSIWRIKTPYMDFITQQDGIDKPLYVCNGIDSEKIYEFSNTQYSDDGVAINSLYTTYGFVNAEKAATVPIFGYHAKRYTILQTNVEGSGNLTIRALPNTLDARYPLTLTGASTPATPGTITLSSPVMDDYYRNLNAKGNRLFLELSTNAVGSWFNLSKLMLSGVADPHSPLNPTGGGNIGIL
jgi:hypothetical protein